MSEGNHTPGKLESNGIRGWELWIGADHHIADVHGQQSVRQANAKRMILCWNSYDQDQETIKDLMKAGEDLRDALVDVLSNVKGTLAGGPIMEQSVLMAQETWDTTVTLAKKENDSTDSIEADRESAQGLKGGDSQNGYCS